MLEPYWFIPLITNPEPATEAIAPAYLATIPDKFFAKELPIPAAAFSALFLRAVPASVPAYPNLLINPYNADALLALIISID